MKAIELSLIAAAILLVSCSPGTRKNNPPLTPDGQPSEDLNLVGGLPITGENFAFAGRFLHEEIDGWKACTLSRIGPKHFLTAGHCEPKTSKIWL